MNIFLIVTGFVLFCVILGVVYRILSLLSIAKGESNQRTDTGNKVNAILFPISFIIGIGAIIWYSNVASDYLLPEAASIHGKKTDFLFWVTIAIIGAVFVITHLLLFLFSYTYRYKKSRQAYFYPDNDKLEIIWTIVPAITMFVLVFLGWRTWHDTMYTRPQDSVVLEIMGKQFNWQVRYPGKDGKLGNHNFRKIDATNSMGVDFVDVKSRDDFMPREIHLPKGRPVQLDIRSRDVLHSVFMPHFRLKMDAVPGMKTHFWFTPTKTTAEMREELSKNPVWQEIDTDTEVPKWQNFNYELACTEVCGSGHFAMRMIIIVEEPEEFQKWYSEQEPWASKNPEYVAQVLAEENEKNLVINTEN